MKKQIIYPNLIPRLFSTILDLFILSILVTPFSSFISYKLSLYFFNSTMADILLLAAQGKDYTANLTFANLCAYTLAVCLLNITIFALYFIGFWTYFSATPGKMIMHMKIVDSETMGKPSKWQLFRRFAGYSIALIGIWSIVFTSKHQALHDKFAGTAIIKT